MRIQRWCLIDVERDTLARRDAERKYVHIGSCIDCARPCDGLIDGSECGSSRYLIVRIVVDQADPNPVVPRARIDNIRTAADDIVCRPSGRLAEGQGLRSVVESNVPVIKQTTAAVL